MTYISFILKPVDLKFGMHVVKTLFYFMKPAVYTYFFLFFRRLKRVGSVLSRSELDPYIYIFLGSNYLIINAVDKMLLLADSILLQRV